MHMTPRVASGIGRCCPGLRGTPLLRHHNVQPNGGFRPVLLEIVDDSVDMFTDKICQDASVHRQLRG